MKHSYQDKDANKPRESSTIKYSFQQWEEDTDLTNLKSSSREFQSLGARAVKARSLWVTSWDSEMIRKFLPPDLKQDRQEWEFFCSLPQEWVKSQEASSCRNPWVLKEKLESWEGRASSLFSKMGLNQAFSGWCQSYISHSLKDRDLISLINLRLSDRQIFNNWQLAYRAFWDVWQ